jgi:hypothetical protein
MATLEKRFLAAMTAYLEGSISAEQSAFEAHNIASPGTDLGGNESLLANCYVALTHLAEPGWQTTPREIEYLASCLSGKQVFSVSGRDRVIST